MRSFTSIFLLLVFVTPFAKAAEQAPEIGIRWVKGEGRVLLAGGSTVIELPESIKPVLESRYNDFRIPDQRDFLPGSDWLLFSEKGKASV